MSYPAPWDNSYYNYSNNTSSNWDSRNHYSQQEQYNPVYPSFNGTSNFFSSSAQQYDAAPYRPTRTSTSTVIPRTHQRQRENRQREKKKTWPQNRFHLITINSGSTEKPEVTKITEAVPHNVNKGVRGSSTTVQSQRGGSSVQKMPNFRLQENGWETNGVSNQGGSRGNWRGGAGRGRGGSNRGRRFYGPPKSSNSKDDIKFVDLPDDAPSITLKVSSENIVAFHGFDSVFTTQHSFPVLIDQKIYTSCDHYYQICKVTDLTGISSDRLNRGVRDETGKLIIENNEEKEKKSHSAIAKDLIKAANIEKENVDEWRNTKGLAAVQKALYAKATQSAHLREALKESGDQILVHAFARDCIYGTGCNVTAIKKWLDDLEKSGTQTLKVPASFPLDESTVQHCPVFAQGRNILGVILMQLREKIRENEIEVVDMTTVYSALRSQPAPIEPMDTSSKSGFTIDPKTAGTF